MYVSHIAISWVWYKQTQRYIGSNMRCLNLHVFHSENFHNLFYFSKLLLKLFFNTSLSRT